MPSKKSVTPARVSRGKEAPRGQGGVRAEAQHLRRLVALLSNVSERITSSLDPAQVLQEVIDGACELTDARYGAVGIFGTSGRLQQFITHGITAQQQARIGPLPEGHGLLGHLQAVQHPLRLDDLGKHRSSVGFPPHHPPMKTFLGVPIRHKGETVGNIYLTEKKGGIPFTRQDEELLIAFATQAAAAIANARLHEEAQAERALFQTLIESSPVAVFLADMDGRVIVINKEGQRTLGTRLATGSPLDPALERLVFRRMDGTIVPLHQLPRRRAIESGQPVLAEELSIEYPDGHKMTYLFNATPVKDSRGRTTGAIVVAQDMSPLQAAEETRNNIVSLVSHELRTPLFHIKGFASSLLQTDVEWDNETRMDFIRTIDQEADRLTVLVSDLLDMSRLESGRLEMDKQETAPESIVDRGVRRAEPFLKEHSLSVNVAPDLPTVRADVAHLERVLANLLENAAKYSRKGTSISLSARQRNDAIEFAIADEGEGIPQDSLEHIFEKFVRLGGPERPPGTGLGLAICKAVVEAHGGRIWAESMVGKGSTFYFTVPMTAPAPAAETRRTAEPSRRQGRTSGRRGGQ